MIEPKKIVSKALEILANENPELAEAVAKDGCFLSVITRLFVKGKRIKVFETNSGLLTYFEIDEFGNPKREIEITQDNLVYDVLIDATKKLDLANISAEEFSEQSRRLYIKLYDVPLWYLA